MKLTRARNELLASLQMSGQEREDRVGKAISPDYWQALCPEIPLEVANFKIGELPFNTTLVEDSLRSLKTKGYFAAGRLISEVSVMPMRACVETVRKAGWPPVFAFAYDPFWSITRVSFIAEFIAALLGAEFNLIMSRVWCYYIPAVRGAGGWTPHADDYREHQGRITLWIALTEATLDNGCMYVVPQDLIYGAKVPVKERLREPLISSEYCLELLHSCRALPAAAGSVLGWDPRTIHWGSKCQEPKWPRISLGCEFVSRGVTPKPHTIDELAPGQSGAALPSFIQRMRHIALSIRIHKGRDLKAARFSQVAEELIRITNERAS